MAVRGPALRRTARVFATSDETRSTVGASRSAAGSSATGQPCFRTRARCPGAVNIKVIVHEAEEGGFWAEVPALPGCVSQGDTMDDLIANIRDAIAGWLTVDVQPLRRGFRYPER